MNEWHPLPPPQMIPLSFVTGQAFHLGFMAGCEAASVFYMVFLSLVVLAVPLGRWLRSRSSASLPLLLAALLFSCAASSRADVSVPGSPSSFSYPGGVASQSMQFIVPAGNWTSAALTFTASGGYSGGVIINVGSASVTTTTPGSVSVVVPVPPSGTVTYSFTTSRSPGFGFNVGTPTLSLVGSASGTGTGTTGTGTGGVSSAPCSGAYPSSVSPLLQSAPQPCDYFHASQGFNSSSAPLLLAVLGVLVVILAIWMGHDTIMSIFRRLVTGMTGG